MAAEWPRTPAAFQTTMQWRILVVCHSGCWQAGRQAGRKGHLALLLTIVGRAL